VNVEPIQVRGIRTAFKNVVEGEEASAGMIENTVQNNADAALMRLLQQGLEGLVAAQQGVHCVIIVGMVTVV